MTKPRILVVEDERVVAADIEESLHKLGYSVVGSAASAVSAIRKAVETEPDLVLMDIKLKGAADGVDAAEELRCRLGIPVVYLTAYADSAILERAKKTTPCGYVLKPFDERALRSAVELALHRHPMERRLIESERSLATALRSIDEAVIITQRRGLVTFMNRGAEALTGWKQQDAVGRHVKDTFTMIDGDTGALVNNPAMRAMRDGVGISLGENTILVGRDGMERWIQGSVVPLRNDEGEVVGAALVFRAASELSADAKLMADKTSLARRREMAGLLAAGLARDFSEIFERINGHARLVGEHEAAEEITRAAACGAALADRLAAFTRVQSARPAVLDLNQLVKGLESLLRCVAGEGVELVTVLGAQAGRVQADSSRIEQALLNLAAGMRGSISHGGSLTIETSEVELLGEFARAHTKLPAGRYALVAMSYTEGGACAEPRETENDLALVRETIHAIGGDIRIYSEPGRLTTFEIYLPKVEEAAA